MSTTPVISPYSFPGIKFKDIPENAFKEHRQKCFKESEKDILNLVAERCGVTVSDIVSESRKREIIDARYIYLAVVKIKYRVTLDQIGSTVGNRDHTSIRHGLIRFMERFEREEVYKSMAESIFKQLGISYHNEKLVSTK